MTRGLFIAFEGIDGTGKSTQLKLLEQYLRSLGHEVVVTREPTDGPYGRKIRELYVDRGRCTPDEELDLFIRDRKQHVAAVIAPALAAGKVVLSFAPEPDMVVLLTMDPEVSVHRIEQLRGESLNDFEQLGQLHKVAELFTSFTQDCITRIDAARPVDLVQSDIREAVRSLLTSNKQ